MKTWDKGTNISKLIEDFTIGQDPEFDLVLAKHDVLGSLAHAKMLREVGLLTEKEWIALDKELKNIYQRIEKGGFTIEKGVEDIHSQVELLLTKKLGVPGKKIHTGRSRNDQVLLDMKLYMRDQLKIIIKDVKILFDVLIKKSEENKNVLIPGYTHYQAAMPSSFGLWFGAYAESLTDDLLLLQTAYKINNHNPLGSAAGYGSSFPINRQLTTELLGFEDLVYNVVYAQMGRGKTEKTVAAALAAIGATLARMAQDICLFVSQNFGFLNLPDEITTGSSIMPHKKNPDVFELIRAKGNKLQAVPNQLSLIINNLLSGYHRDLQELKAIMIPAFNDIISMLKITHYSIDKVKVKKNILDDEKYKYIFSVEAVNNKVIREGKSFRDAYKEIATVISDGSFKAIQDIQHTHEGSIGNLCNDMIKKKMDNILKEFSFVKEEKAIKELIK